MTEEELFSPQSSEPSCPQRSPQSWKDTGDKRGKEKSRAETKKWKASPQRS